MHSFCNVEAGLGLRGDRALSAKNECEPFQRMAFLTLDNPGMIFYAAMKPLEGLISDAKPQFDGRSRRDTPTWSAFRNDVIHNGYIPSTEEVIEYGNLVYQFIYRLIGELKTNCAEFIGKATFHHLARGHVVSEGKSVGTMSVPTLISLVRAERPAQHLRDALPGLEKYRRWLYGRPQANP